MTPTTRSRARWLVPTFVVALVGALALLAAANHGPPVAEAAPPEWCDTHWKPWVTTSIPAGTHTGTYTVPAEWGHVLVSAVEVRYDDDTTQVFPFTPARTVTATVTLAQHVKAYRVQMTPDPDNPDPRCIPPTEPTTPPTTSPPTEPTSPPTEPTSPPTTSPPTEPTSPPTTSPPTEPTSPPTEPTSPPTEPTSPPTEPTAPPTTAPVTTAPGTTLVPPDRECPPGQQRFTWPDGTTFCGWPATPVEPPIAGPPDAPPAAPCAVTNTCGPLPHTGTGWFTAWGWKLTIALIAAGGGLCLVARRRMVTR